MRQYIKVANATESSKVISGSLVAKELSWSIRSGWLRSVTICGLTKQALAPTSMVILDVALHAKLPFCAVVDTSRSSSQSWAVRRVRQLDILKQLIQKKEAIGSDIAKCASQLDMFFNTASSELKVTLEYRSDLANGLTQLDKPHT